MLTKGERKALMVARALIESGERNYICFALGAAWAMGVCSRKELCRLKRYIQDQLGAGESGSLWGWQKERGMFPTDDQIRKDRIAWIDWMLDQ